MNLIGSSSNVNIQCSLLDQQKGFDTKDLNVLLLKLEAFEVRGVWLD